MIKVGTSHVDISPKVGQWMDGLQRAHESESIHDPLSARALALDNGQTKIVIVSLELVGLTNEFVAELRRQVKERTGIPAENIFLACSHSHSGPATIGYFSPREEEYVRSLGGKLLEAIEESTKNMVPAKVGMARGEETTISHYRRLWNKAGKIIMNWEPVDPETIVGPAGEPDHEVGVLKFVAAEDQENVLAQLFHYTTHPNVLSGESYAISAEFPGLAARVIEEQMGGLALYVNGALGSSDIDGLRDRDWVGVERTGKALARAVLETSEKVRDFQTEVALATCVRDIEVPLRCVSDEEVAWAKKVLAEATGEVVMLLDGVTDEFKADLIMGLSAKRGQNMGMELGGVAIGGMALLAFPGELFTEIGMAVKKASPFKQTYIMGLTNGNNGYFPSTKAVAEGGYAVDTRRVDPPTEQIIIDSCADMLGELGQKIK